jgi:hypothetical protein
MSAQGHNVSVSDSLAQLHAYDNAYGQRKSAMCLVLALSHVKLFCFYVKIKLICYVSLARVPSVDAFNPNIIL